jgi:RNA polymerase sigma factor (sigma-70 family)
VRRGAFHAPLSYTQVVAPLFRRSTTADAAFERLYERHVRDVYRYAAGMLGTRADAEDVTQTTFLNAYRAFTSGTRPEKPQSWLIAIAHNVCRQRFRQAQRRPREVAFDERIGEGATDEVTAPTAEDLRRALSELPPNQRAAVVMRELEGCSYAEIADVLGISISALETLLFRARRALREQLEEQLTCQDAALAINRQLDGRLSLGERRALRAHLRACVECNSLAQSQRAQRRALKALVLVPLPATISHWVGSQTAAAATGAAGAGGLTAAGVTAGGGAAGASSVVFGGVAAKVAAVVVAGAVVGGGAYEGVTQVAKPAARSTQPSAKHVQSASKTPSTHKSNAPGLEAARLAPVVVTRTPRSIVRRIHAANAARSIHRKAAAAPGQTVKVLAHTPVDLRTAPPGLAVKSTKTTPASTTASTRAHANTTKTKAETQRQTRSHPTHPAHAAPKAKKHPTVTTAAHGRRATTDAVTEEPTP